ncbi:hypothetical protein [Neorhizobium sp. NCHU2750]|uniref:hypothetical protein n=1 Tax=Neorhizobium sp. NCHU2750 TaxID=1825976 RepID=UPI0013C4BFA7
MLSTLLVAVPTVRAAYRILLARWKSDRAERKEAAMPSLAPQQRQTAKVEIDLLRNQAGDLIEFSTLVPTWAVCFGLLGMFLNIIARAIPFFG